jgi:hypothetical protein
MDCTLIEGSHATSNHRSGAVEGAQFAGLRRVFKGTLILNSDYSLDDGFQAVRLGEADAIAFGGPFFGQSRFAGTVREAGSAQPAEHNTFTHLGLRGIRLSNVCWRRKRMRKKLEGKTAIISALWRLSRQQRGFESLQGRQSYQ